MSGALDQLLCSSIYYLGEYHSRLGGGAFPWLLALGLGATIDKERAAPRGGRAAGPYDGRRPCARVARERELTLVRALPYPNCSPRKYYLPIKYYAEIVLSPNKILCGDSTISK